LVYPSPHPLVAHKIAALRDARTDPAAFRALVRDLARLLAYEATADLATKMVEIATPLGPCPSKRLAGSVVIVPILRAGLGMSDGLLDMIPEAQVWHVGLYRDESTLEPKEYYCKLHDASHADIALIVDPMLATGGTSVHACGLLRAAGVRRIKLVALIAAPEGIATFSNTFPDVPIHVAAIDERLTEVGYIYPGLGDAGDRQFATL